MLNSSTLLERFHRDGYLVIPDALAAEPVGRLRAGVERGFAERCSGAELYGRIMFERGPEFEALVDNPRVIDLVEAILGADCHLFANSALRTGPGDRISNWHSDETVRSPRPADVPTDSRIAIPRLCEWPGW